MKHILKTHRPYFQAVKSGKKTFEVRKNDRRFANGHILCLLEFDPKKERLTGESVDVEVVYVLKGGAFGIADGYVVMAVRLCSFEAAANG